MKITTRYIVGIVILVVGLFAILLIRPSRFVWTPTFAHEDKNPLGCFVFDSVMVQTMPRGYKATGATLRETIADSSSNNVLIVTRDGKLTDANITDIKRLLDRGSTVMLVGVDIYEDSNADKAFGLQCITYANFFYNEIKNKLAHNSDDLYDSLHYRAVYKDAHGTKRHRLPRCIAYPDADYRIYKTLLAGVVNIDSAAAVHRRYYILSHCVSPYYDDEYKPDNDYKAVMVEYGRGRLVVVTTPLLFTNFGIISPSTQPYVMRLMNTLADKPVVRLDASMKGGAVIGADADKHNASPLSYILSQPPLRWAYYTIIAGALVFIIFTARRRQRVIPVIPEKKNHDMEFVRLIGKLYYEHHDNSDLVLKKFGMLADQVRNTLDIDLNDRHNRQDHVRALSDASHVSIYDLGALLDELHAIRDDQLAIRDDDMVRLIGQMNRIIKNL